MVPDDGLLSSDGAETIRKAQRPLEYLRGGIDWPATFLDAQRTTMHCVIMVAKLEEARKLRNDVLPEICVLPKMRRHWIVGSQIQNLRDLWSVTT